MIVGTVNLKTAKSHSNSTFCGRGDSEIWNPLFHYLRHSVRYLPQGHPLRYVAQEAGATRAVAVKCRNAMVQRPITDDAFDVAKANFNAAVTRLDEALQNVTRFLVENNSPHHPFH